MSKDYWIEVLEQGQVCATAWTTKVSNGSKMIHVREVTPETEDLASKYAEALEVIEHMASDEFKHDHIEDNEFGESCRTTYIGHMTYAREFLAKHKPES